MKKLFINGQWVNGVDELTHQLINPATEEKLQTISFANAKDATIAIEAAQEAFKKWRLTTPYTRATILKKAADYLRVNIDTIARDMVLESGKPLAEAKGEFTVAANLFEWYAEEAKRSYGKIIPTNRTDKRSSVIWQPMGVVGVITAWNFPAYNPARAWAAALAAGCSVVAKPSEHTPLSAYHLAKALEESGLPAGVLNVLVGDAAAIGELMLRHKAVKKISFTGSTAVGKILMDGASKTHTRLSLELGGNAPVIIFDDVDVVAIAKAAVLARFRNNGQVCIAPQRFYIQHTIYHQFAETVTALVAAIKIGDGFEEAVQVGPLITKKQRDAVLALLEKAKSEQAEILTGGTVPADKEKFGPILPLFSFTDAADAIQKANDTEYGLAAYIFTNQLSTAIHVSEALDFGMVGINEWAPHGTEAPFGGWNFSGQGHESGSDGLYEYMEKKLISIGSL
jgi:acyl-CoA reductase-like NAD-dependent aldehyde dehydrogenase